MLLRSRLKKELVNLWTLKNKKVYVFTAVLLLGLLTILKPNDDMPEDKRLSSGYSVIKGNMVKIDNYSNIINYEYKLNKRKKVSKKELQKLAKEKFGEIPGLAQQYLFYWRRENK